jgi:hypothetical protein
MNASRLNLVLGIVIVALLGVIGSLYSKLPTEAPEPAPQQPAKERSNSLAGAPAEKEPAPAGPVAEPASSDVSHTWKTVESEDYRKYIANLRSIGCPEETIHDIIRADVNKLLDSRKAEKRKPFEYWKTGNLQARLMDAETVKLHAEINEQKRDLMKQLLGEDAKLDTSATAQAFNPLDAMIDFLPGEKQVKLVEKINSWNAEAAPHVSGGRPDSAQMEELKKVRDKIEAELNAMLTPQEKRDYDLRLSNTSLQMQQGLGDFNPSKEEFESIFDLRLAFDKEHSVLSIPPADEAGREARKAAEEVFKEDVGKLLGPDRFKEFERAPRQEYQLAVKIAERQGLDRSVGGEVYDMKVIVQEQVEAIRDSGNMTSEQQTAALQAIQIETQVSVGKLLGDEGFSSYSSQRGGNWLNNIAPGSN